MNMLVEALASKWFKNQRRFDRIILETKRELKGKIRCLTIPMINVRPNGLFDRRAGF